MTVLKDGNGDEIVPGIYRDKGDFDHAKTEFYDVMRSGQDLVARTTASLNVLKLGIPLGMPDSLIMPEGEIDAFGLVPVSQPELGDCTAQLRIYANNAFNRASRLESFKYAIDRQR